MPTEVIKTKERPIIFSGPMVRAILDGRKTQTRRIIKQVPTYTHLEWNEGPKKGQPRRIMDWGLSGVYEEDPGKFWLDVQTHVDDNTHEEIKCPYGTVGDRLWVRETYCQKAEDGYPVYNADGNLDPSCYHYAADGYYVMKCDGDGGMEFTKSGREASPWKSPIFMPRHASRITLEVVSVRVERLQEITEDDVAKEGFIEWSDPPRVTSKHYGLTNADVWETSPKSAFARVWREINGPLSWDCNPWVWRVEFKRVQQ